MKAYKECEKCKHFEHIRGRIVYGKCRKTGQIFEVIGSVEQRGCNAREGKEQDDGQGRAYKHKP